MRFNIDKKILSEAIINIIRAVSTKSTIPALEGLLIETFENELEITAYDLELGMKTRVPAEILEEGKIILSAKLFSEIVRKAPAVTISVNIDEKFIATIESGQSSFNIVGINPQEFPPLPNVSNDESIKISGEILKGMIRQTIFAVADNDIKPINQGSLFNFENGIFDLVSLDGFRLAVRRECINIQKNTSFVVPGKTLTEVLKLATDQDIEIFEGRRHIMFKIENYTIISSIFEGEFLDYKSALNINTKTVIEIKTRDLIEITERVSLLISDRLKSPVRCKFDSSDIEVSCTTAMGRAKDSCLAEMKCGEFIEMGFNSKYLLDALKNTESDKVKLNIAGPINPMLVTPLEGEEFMFLVLPVRIK